MSTAVEAKQITIKTLVVDGKRMSRAFFDQIQDGGDWVMSWRGAEYIGYVAKTTGNTPGFWLLFTLPPGGALYRHFLRMNNSSIQATERWQKKLEGLEQLFIY